MTEALKYLVVEDETDIRRLLCDSLRSCGAKVREADSIARALALSGEAQPDLVILDLGLPDGDGVRFIREFRVWSENPILVLSARSAEIDKIRALDAGADDYIEKPFSVGELHARLRALLRRSEHQRDSSGQYTYQFGNVEVDLARHAVSRSGAPVHLTALEFRLLALLLVNAGKVMTHRKLLAEVWGPGHTEDGQYLRIYVGHLRQKLEEDPSLPRHFRTEVGVGYRFIL